MARLSNKTTPKPGDLVKIVCMCEECKNRIRCGQKRRYDHFGVWTQSSLVNGTEKYSSSAKLVILDKIGKGFNYKVAIDGEVRYIKGWKIEYCGRIIG